MRFILKPLTVFLGVPLLLAGEADDAKRRPAGKAELRERGPKPGSKMERGRRGPLSDRFMSSYDHDRNGRISYQEFASARKTASLEEEGTRRLFNHLDKNKDGDITRDELPKGAPHPARRGDQDGDGKISFEEFRRNPRLKGADDKRLKAMFARMDLNQDGFLTQQDFGRRGGGFPGPGDFEKLDLDRDGGLSYEEWRKSPHLKKEGIEDDLRRRFGMLDRNGDGKLDGRERPGGEGTRPKPGPRHRRPPPVR